MDPDTNSKGISDEEVEHRMAEADGALGAAGHQVTNPVTRELLRQKIRGEITGRQYLLQVAEHALGYVPASMQDAY